MHRLCMLQPRLLIRPPKSLSIKLSSCNAAGCAPVLRRTFDFDRVSLQATRSLQLNSLITHNFSTLNLESESPTITAKIREVPERAVTVLIDAHALIFRAFHAIPPMNRKDGTPTNAVYGFMRTILKVLKDTKPEYAAVLFDSPGKSFRHEISPQYKANRRRPPADLRVQFDFCVEAARALNLPIVRMDAVEADDLIAACCLNAVSRGHRVVIVSPDKDLLQLLENPNVLVYDPIKFEIIGEKEVKEKLGVPPSAVADYLALVGDSSDNISGVPGIGPKIAAALLEQFGSVAKMLENLSQIESVVRRERLKAFSAALENDLLLTRLRSEVDGIPDIETFKTSEPDPKKLRFFLESLEFRSLIRMLKTESDTPAALFASPSASPAVGSNESPSVVLPASSSPSSALILDPPNEKEVSLPADSQKKNETSASATSPVSSLPDLDPVPSIVQKKAKLRGRPRKVDVAPEKKKEEVAQGQEEKRTPSRKKQAVAEEEDEEDIARTEDDNEAEVATENPEEEESEPKKKKKLSKKAQKELELQNLPPPLPPPAERPVLYAKAPGVTIVQDVETARKVLAKLQALEDCYHGIDTETVGVDLRSESIFGHGTVICFSIYCGEAHDFGAGPRVWVDCLGPLKPLLHEFKPYFENEKLKKVWHNYGFDRHALGNHGIDVKGFGGDTMHMARLWNAGRSHGEGYSLEDLSNELLEKRKRTIKERFGSLNIRVDGTEGKTVVVPDLDELQRSEEQIVDWIDYSTYDAEATWRLREVLEKRLRAMPWQREQNTHMMNFYELYWKPFGELLTDMEKLGIKVDVGHLKSVEAIALHDMKAAEEKFRQWAQKRCPDAKWMNVSSDAQKQQLLFAPATNKKTGEVMPNPRAFKTLNTDQVILEGKKKALKHREILISGLGLPPIDYAASGWPAVGNDVLKVLAGSPSEGKFGKLVKEKLFADPDEAKEASFALEALSEVQAIDTLLNSFIIPLQTQVDSNSRIHGSLNINTETGRLSSRRPNLQNQPALEKDRYKIRKAFCAEQGNVLVVADYGQLELRLLAHMTKCKSMLDAFKKGGDFHSRTAIGMYPHVQEAVEKGTCLLEWDSAKKGKPPAPLLKDMFSTERRRAKVLNFSIAYGKTPVGLAKDWNVSVREAQNTLDLWYKDRPEVREWQKRTIDEAHRTGYTRTLLGRYRPLPQINSQNMQLRKHSERAAINTPLQGGAADVVVCAMLQLHRNERLKSLGYKTLLQIHDEVILEGPKEAKDEALDLVKNLMGRPFPEELLVDLIVDARAANTWLEAK